MNRRRVIALAGGAIALVPLGWFGFRWLTFPSDQTPEGAYLRVITAVNQGRPELFFAYTETAVQHACFTIRNYRRHSRNVILRAYPEPERTRLAKLYEPHATAADGAEVFARFARERGWLDRLRRDMSGVKQVEIRGERATVETVHGTRYPFRRRPNGIWGLTLFTAALVAEAQKAARDAKLIDQGAADYERAQRQAP